jgi:D-erythrulose 1-phosphate 3-epimerase
VIKKYKLSINTGFAVNRFNNNEIFIDFIKNHLKLNYIQPTSDWLYMNLPDRYIFKNVKQLDKILSKYNVKVNSLFTGAFTRLNHLGHPDKEHQMYWVNWFKRFIDVGIDLGADHVGSHLGIFSYQDNKQRKKLIKTRIIKNWHLIGEYAYKKKIKSLIWEPMSIAREFGETLNECHQIHSLLNKKKYKFNLCLDVGHGDINSKNKFNYDPYKWLEKFSSESPVIHIKQVKKNNFAHLPFTKKDNKHGIIKPNKILEILKKNNNSDTELAFELSFKERDPIDKNLKKNILETVQYWKKFLN